VAHGLLYGWQMSAVPQMCDTWHVKVNMIKTLIPTYKMHHKLCIRDWNMGQ